MEGQIIDIENKRIYPGRLTIEAGVIKSVDELKDAPPRFILPGFVDAHVHIESSMLVPSEFAKMAVTHGTVATVSDPHEIGNVLGVAGVEFMIENAKTVPLKFNFGAPSCVPATPFETAGAIITAEDIDYLLSKPEIKYLAEMMNWPGVLHRDALVMDKIKVAQKHGKPVDGHAPGLKGEQAATYISAGISTDHECFTIEEALNKLKHGMKILIREGSAAKNFEALIPLMKDHADQLMFCSDDKHPDNLIEGHINQLVVRALKKGHDLFDVLQVACINPVRHYGLNVGLLQKGDPADFIVIGSIETFNVLETWTDGQKVAEHGKALFVTKPCSPINQFNCQPKKPSDFYLKMGGSQVRVIDALDGQLITRESWFDASLLDSDSQTSIEHDVLKFAVINRYSDQPPAIAYIRNFGLKEGAIASTVGHDSHNILAIGVSNEAICETVNLLVENKGGIAAIGKGKQKVLPLPVAGLMAKEDGYTVGNKYQEIDLMAKELGSTLSAPFMTLSFMALLVIPMLKLSDQGLFDGERFTFVPLFKE
ncbi:adenine deaminase [Imperialibacter roseus]|uniref:Adenine deaminase n=1 Tax=Imperialibacter roseus TaxID=1324217 RepID=A0ABZ0IRD9_9BACT|nr:adenine deaminase [Imperialibacter roseus]WOK07622.1 adenine deaminase [Imperialibacter roseus]